MGKLGRPKGLLFTLVHIDPSLDAIETEYPWLIVLFYWMIDAFDRVLEGADVEEALTDAQAKAEALVACLGEDKSRIPWRVHDPEGTC